jgi:hypothetical protein
MTFLEEVKAEAKRAVEKFGEYNSLHEGFAVMYEEVDELWEIVRMKRSKRVPEDIRGELVQIAACCLKINQKFGVPDAD